MFFFPGFPGPLFCSDFFPLRSCPSIKWSAQGTPGNSNGDSIIVWFLKLWFGFVGWISSHILYLFYLICTKMYDIYVYIIGVCANYMHLCGYFSMLWVSFSCDRVCCEVPHVGFACFCLVVAWRVRKTGRFWRFWWVCGQLFFFQRNATHMTCLSHGELHLRSWISRLQANDFCCKSLL